MGVAEHRAGIIFGKTLGGGGAWRLRGTEKDFFSYLQGIHLTVQTAGSERYRQNLQEQAVTNESLPEIFHPKIRLDSCLCCYFFRLSYLRMSDIARQHREGPSGDKDFRLVQCSTSQIQVRCGPVCLVSGSQTKPRTSVFLAQARDVGDVDYP